MPAVQPAANEPSHNHTNNAMDEGNDDDDDDDDVDFNLGGGAPPSNSYAPQQQEQEEEMELAAPTMGTVHKASAKDDG